MTLKIIRVLLDEGCRLRLYDPQAMPNTQGVFPASTPGLAYCDSAYDAARGAQALLVLTEWDEFRELDLQRLREIMEVPIIVDGRNLFDPEAVAKAGFEYVCMGRAGAAPAGVQTPAVP
jgi:UDPglucose 6-dehydrogenase